MSDIKVVKIDGSRWLEGNYSLREGSESMLLNSTDNRMCCLGFLCVQLVGASPTEIMNLATPADIIPLNLGEKFEELGLLINPPKGFNRDSDLSVELVEVNDMYRKNLKQEDRIRKLNEVCEKYNANFRFELE